MFIVQSTLYSSLQTYGMIRKIYFCTTVLNKNDDEQSKVDINDITDMEIKVNKIVCTCTSNKADKKCT
jgi:hypothetical protein